MKYWEFVQTGNREQCNVNGLSDHQYIFALRKRNELNPSYSGYIIPSLGFGISLRPAYAMSFRLTLSF